MNARCNHVSEKPVALFCRILLVRERALTKKYSLECATYRLDSSRDTKHLDYVLFLNKLADQQYTREDIVKLRRAVEIAEIPNWLQVFRRVDATLLGSDRRQPHQTRAVR